ncbi:MAG: hypothetical protein HY816_09885 [Candidatus Wallbacteria bacterium]|nr:hypothetical protein [Candidatus Wallbacteria bacterium]
MPCAPSNKTFAARHQDELRALLTRLGRPDLPPGRKAALEDHLRRVLRSPALLADCSTLPTDHPLRTAAREVAAAFDAVSRGLARPAELAALSGIAEDSPLAPWKALVGAVDAFHRGDAAACRRALDRIDPRSEPARLRPAFEQLLTGSDPSGLPPGLRGLVTAIRGNSKELGPFLAAVDAALAARKLADVLASIDSAVRRCSDSAPQLLDDLCRRIAAKCLAAKFPQDRIYKALERRLPRNSEYYRWMAAAAERARDAVAACASWDMFRILAIAEGRFPELSPEHATVLQVMAAHAGSPFVSSGRRLNRAIEGTLFDNPDRDALVLALEKLGMEPPKARPEDYLAPARLLEEACRVDPSDGTFGLWLDWCLRFADSDAAARVARTWMAVHPQAARPALLLATDLERAGKPDRALAILEKSEAAGAEDPRIRAVRVRILAAAVLDQLCLRRPELAAGALERLRVLPHAAEGERPVIVAALKEMVARALGDSAAASRARREVEKALGGKLPAELLLHSLHSVGRVDGKHPPSARGIREPDLAAALNRVTPVLQAVEVDLELPGNWSRPVGRLLGRGDGLLAPATAAALERLLMQTSTESSDLFAESAESDDTAGSDEEFAPPAPRYWRKGDDDVPF